MDVFVTGATGFIGSRLALRCLDAGHEVVALGQDRNPVESERARELEARGVRPETVSVTDREGLAQACRGVELVHHLAAAQHEANVPDRHFWEVNVEATRRMLERSRDGNVERFVYCSSIGVMGKSPPKPADETTPGKPEDIYQVTKKAAEEMCLEFQARHDFPLTAVRPADVYGPRDRRLLKLFKGVKTGRFAMIGNGRNVHHMVYVDDLVDGMVLAGERDEAIGEAFILAGDEATSVNDLTEIVAGDLGVRPPRVRVPLLPVQMAAVVIEAACRPFGIQPPLYPRRVDFFRTVQQFEKDFLQYINDKHSALLSDLSEKGDLTDEITEGLEAAIKEFKAGYKPAA